MLRKQQDGYTLTLCDVHLSDSSRLIDIIKYVIHLQDQLVRTDGGSLSQLN